MRKILSFMAILTLTAATIQPTRAQAQQDPAQDQSTAPAPTPDKDGVYQPGPGIAPPYITSPAQAIWPASTSTPTDPDAPPSPENANPPGTPGGPVPHPPTHLVHFTAVKPIAAIDSRAAADKITQISRFRPPCADPCGGPGGGSNTPGGGAIGAAPTGAGCPGAIEVVSPACVSAPGRAHTGVPGASVVTLSTVSPYRSVRLLISLPS